MEPQALLIAILLGILQGIFEWLPISSEGNITLLLTAMGWAHDQSVQYSLFLHLGTAVAATGYFKTEIRELVELLPSLPAWDGETRELRFLILATLVSGAVGVAAYAALISLVTAIEGGLLIVAIGVLLVVTGLMQRISADSTGVPRTNADWVDAILVGVGQGLAVLPGISRSGTTVGVLLLRGYEGERAFRLSFLLSIPASVGAGVLVLADTGGLSGLSPIAGLVALAVSAVVGLATIHALMRLVRRVDFGAICIGLGALAIGGGLLTIL
jgi:undecaprenyl-diphosphatase